MLVFPGSCDKLEVAKSEVQELTVVGSMPVVLPTFHPDGRQNGTITNVKAVTQFRFHKLDVGLGRRLEVPGTLEVFYIGVEETKNGNVLYWGHPIKGMTADQARITCAAFNEASGLSDDVAFLSLGAYGMEPVDDGSPYQLVPIEDEYQLWTRIDPAGVVLN
ncbi:MAG: hypothetical protein PHS44_04095 [Candidatus Dojkabacteria bacterium]|nr:hypothetical protein [Candidatus Dojkabacteria bacterium]